MPTGQQRAPNLIIDVREPPCGCLELSSGPLEDQPLLLTVQPSLQPSFSFKFYLTLFYLGWAEEGGYKRMGR